MVATDDLIVRYNSLDTLIGYNPKSTDKPFYLLDNMFINISSTSLYDWVKIPKGYTSDGCSIPFLLRPLLGCKHNPRFVAASIIHDYIVEHPATVQNNRKLSSRIFRKVLLQEGNSLFMSNLLYHGVEIGQIYNTIFKGKWRKCKIL